jgi:hypothetical protein
LQRIEIRLDRRSPKQEEINSICRGYSDYKHWLFFKKVLSSIKGHDVLMLGVYQGRDIAYISALLKLLGIQKYSITGVDKFDDSPCMDWPEDKHGMRWQEAGFGVPPDLNIARKNLAELGLSDNVLFVQNNAEDFLKNSKKFFDLIYIDVSHDYQTTMNCIDLAVPRLTAKGHVGGDDFSDIGTWGVASAVKESFASFKLFYDWIWLANKSAYSKK